MDEYLQVERGEQYARITLLTHRLDVLVAPSLKSEMVVLSGMGCSRVVLDLSACEYCDSSGLSAILMGHRLCRTASGLFVLTGILQAVERLIRIAQLDRHLHIAYTPDQVEDLMKKLP